MRHFRLGAVPFGESVDLAQIVGIGDAACTPGTQGVFQIFHAGQVLDDEVRVAPKLVTLIQILQPVVRQLDAGHAGRHGDRHGMDQSRSVRRATTKAPKRSKKAERPARTGRARNGRTNSSAGRSVMEYTKADSMPNATRLPRTRKGGESAAFRLRNPIIVVAVVRNTGQALSRSDLASSTIVSTAVFEFSGKASR